ncbi:MAG: DUF192 domain-containing protein [Nitrosopumilus sp.]|nr:DUF192 domain-containing protein [Nitrosopumilus sp.]MDH3486563.1 DUF192 domain-containing protein [Nitrosopumilus sp.]
MFSQTVWVGIIVGIFLAVIGIAMFGATLTSDSADYDIIDVDEQSFYSNMIKLDDVLIDVQIADTDVKRNRGLMFEEQMPYDQGTLFIYEESGNYSFWMYNMQFALDIIWFDDKGNVVHIKQDVPPCATEPEYCTVYDPGVDAFYVFETTAGFVDKFGITEDSKFFWIVENTI